MMFVDVCMKDTEEPREVANRHEILVGAYQPSSARYEREKKEVVLEVDLDKLTALSTAAKFGL